MTIESSAGEVYLSDGSIGIGLKIQSDLWELNISFFPDEVEKERAVGASSWEDGSIRAGTSAGSPVHWSSDDGIVSILVGHNDETLDFCVFITPSQFQDVIESLQHT